MNQTPTMIGSPIRDGAVDPHPDDFMPMRHPNGHPEAWMHAEVGTPEYNAAVAELRAQGGEG